jgi:hypothetical protein
MGIRLLKLIGLGDDFLEHLDQVVFAFQRPALLGLLVLLLPIGLFIYRRQRQNLASLPPALLAALSLIRILILALLILILAGPYARIDHTSERKPLVALLLDHSGSMNLPAGALGDEREIIRLARAAGFPTAVAAARQSLDRASRAELVHAVLRASGKSFLEPLAGNHELRSFSFARERTPLPIDPAQPELPAPPSPGGTVSCLGDAIAGVLEEAAGRPVAGIVLFSDGQNTAGRSLADAGRLAGDARVPIFTVPAGSPVALRDVAVVDVFTAGQVSVGDRARVAVTLESHGFDGRSVRVELREGERLLDSRDVVLRGSEQQHAELSFPATAAGAHYLTVHVPPLAEEPEFLRTNNADTAFVRVTDEKLRVLYLEGLPRWDFRFLKNALRRDHGLGGRLGKDPDILLEAELRRLPPANAALRHSADEWSHYHTILLGDVSPEILTPKMVEQLDDVVRNHGVGLIVAAGPIAMPHCFAGRLHELLPVRLRAGAAGMEAAYKPFHMELTPEGLAHEALRLYDDPTRNQNLWDAMSPFYWCAATDRPSPGASVLAVNTGVTGRFGSQPLIAHHFAGRGRVLFVGTDSTWQWRRYAGDRFFDKFWGQALRFVARRDDGPNRNRLEIRPLRLQPSEPAQVELFAFAADGTPRTQGQLSVRLQGEGGALAIELSSDPMSKGRYTGRFTPPGPGQYTVRYEPGDGTPVEARVRVLAASEELRHPNVNRPALAALAGASGGRLVELPDLASIPGALKAESQHLELHREATVWDNPLTLLVLVILYSIDVGLRRLRGLS